MIRGVNVGVNVLIGLAVLALLCLLAPPSASRLGRS
jgi:Tfp pilus assembly protein FimT